MISSFSKIKPLVKKKHLKYVGHTAFWFLAGAAISLFLISSFSYFGYQKLYEGKVYPGIKINEIDFSEKTEKEVSDYFISKNKEAQGANFIFTHETYTATISAKDIEFGYDEKLLTKQAMSLGRSNSPFSNISIMILAYTKGVDLSPSYNYSEVKLDEKINPIAEKIDKKPIEALFNFENGRVTEFRASEDGKEVNKEELNKIIISKAISVLNYSDQKIVNIKIPVKTIQPGLSTDKVNQMGIKELIGIGTSSYKGSIENRAFNINLAASRINGVLVKPGETFSFNKNIGDISASTGFKQAYVIQNGRTVLGDGGGVCQVSTTFFRSILNAGLPIVERNQHAYRVSYYEQDSLPGIDAAIYTPNIDFKFKNDTKNHILIQAVNDAINQQLTFMLYGTLDGRTVEMSTPVVTSQSPAPEPKYEDDPNLPVGQLKQVDFAAAGAKVFFTRTVKKEGKTIIEETFNSNYRPWQAVFQRGTKPL